MKEIEELKRKLEESLKENKQLKSLLDSQSSSLVPFNKKSEKSDCRQTKITIAGQVNNDSPSEAKIALFRSLFRGREDVYPVRWESQKGISGYSPACRNEWNRAFCNKPRVKCGQCDNREFLPVTDAEIYNHLSGKKTMGVYPMLTDDTCLFLAADFDKSTWKDDATAYLETCSELNVPAVLERSRSGNGCHVWIFFTEPVAASLARKLGCAILTKTMEKRHQIGLDSYPQSSIFSRADGSAWRCT